MLEMYDHHVHLLEQRMLGGLRPRQQQELEDALSACRTALSDRDS
jgi:hypothetical protein